MVLAVFIYRTKFHAQPLKDVHRDAVGWHKPAN
jgi:hypothetical protein